MAQLQHIHSLNHLEEAVTVLFCLIDDTYALLNPGAERYEAIKRLSHSSSSCEGWSPAALSCATLRGSSRTCFRAWWGSAPFLFAPADEEAEALSGTSATRDPPRELVGDPETLLIDSTLLEVLRPRQVTQSVGSGKALWREPHG
jgi:hypothetical protein